MADRRERRRNTAKIGTLVVAAALLLTPEANANNDLSSLRRRMASSVPSVNPLKDKFPAKFLTLADFGATLARQGAPDVDLTTKKAKPVMCPQAQGGYGSRVNKKTPYVECNSQGWWYHWNSQANVAKLMADSATKSKPLAIITQGDNFYWDGVANEKSKLFDEAFEKVYYYPSLLNVDFLITLGNHDIAGSAYICGNDPGTLEDHDSWHKICSSAEDTRNGVNKYMLAAKNYKSPNNNRWKYEGPYYKNAYTADGVSIEVFTIDTNVADVHGLDQICCQCYGYTEESRKKCTKENANSTTVVDCDQCEMAHRGHPTLCAPNDIYDACHDTITGWFTSGLKQLEADLKKSTATWKIVNTHYCPSRHFANKDIPAYKSLMSVISGKAQVLLCGHTHATSHDYDSAAKVHQVMAGNGGGITVESAGTVLKASFPTVDTIWSGGGYYGYLEILASKNWLKVSSLTMDDSWVHQETPKAGGASTKYCTYIPVDGTAAISCDKASSWVPGASFTGGSNSTSGGSSTSGNGGSSSTGGDSVSTSTSFASAQADMSSGVVIAAFALAASTLHSVFLS